MTFKTAMQRLLALLIIGGALIFGMSGIYHEAPWIIPPLFGSVKIELGGKHFSANTETLKAKITKREIAQLDYFTRRKSADLRGSNCYRSFRAWARRTRRSGCSVFDPAPDGQIVDNNVEELDLKRLTSDHVPAMLDALSCLTNIRAYALR